MTDKATLAAEQDRARRIGQQLHDQQSQRALAAYITELEDEKSKAAPSAPSTIKLRI